MLVLLCLLLLLLLGCLGLFFQNRRYARHLRYQNSIIAALPVSIFVFDNHKRVQDIVNVVPGFLWGHSKKDIVGKRVSDFVEKDDFAYTEASRFLESGIDRLLAGEKVEPFRYIIRGAHQEATVKRLNADCIISIVSDITAYFTAMKAMMQKKQNEISVALNAGGLTSWSYDVDAQTIDSTIDNEVVYQRMTLSELLSHINEEDRLLVTDAFDALIAGTEEHREFSVRVLDKYGVLHWENVHAVPDAFAADGRVIGLIGSQKNITKEVESVNELIRLRQKAEESNRLKSAFLSNMSHEIRTPLNAIVGFSGILATVEDEAEKAEYVEIIEKNNALLLNIINDVLDLSRIESGKTVFEYTHISVFTLLSGLVKSTRLKVKDGVEVVLDALPSGLLLYSDENRLLQVLANFLTNAAKFTFAGSIHLGVQLIGEQLRFYVQDTGIGIAKDDLARIFDRFVKLNTFAQGTGLGLPLCENIAHNLGGEIGVESELGKGSCFWIKLPRK
ncbi:MAG: ATP-binding protein [Bacteroides sp.]